MGARLILLDRAYLKIAALQDCIYRSYLVVDLLYYIIMYLTIAAILVRYSTLPTQKRHDFTFSLPQSPDPAEFLGPSLVPWGGGASRGRRSSIPFSN